MPGKTAQDYADQYTKPKLRERLKEDLKASGKGGRRGQWSARKSQLLAQEYERQGGGYRKAKKAPQRSLEQWTAQDWQTIGGAGRARRDGSMHRYLPSKVWAMLSADERRDADRTKVRKDSKGRQVADWPRAVHEAMTAAGHTAQDASQLSQARLRAFAANLDIAGRSSMKKADLLRAIRRQYRIVHGIGTDSFQRVRVGCGVHRGPKLPGSRVERGGGRPGLPGAPVRKAPNHQVRPLPLYVLNQRGLRGLVPGILLPRRPVHHERPLHTAVKNVIVPVNGIVRNHGVGPEEPIR